MLSSIHPLGERTRNNKWLITVMSFTIGAVIGGSLVGALLGSAGKVMITTSDHMTGAVIGVIVLVAGILDLTGLGVPGPSRQVNEHWIGSYRGWVYGGAFGVELGTGIMTYVVTWVVYAMFVSEFLLASPTAGAIVGGVFGAGRSASLLLAGRIDSPSRLTAFHRRMANLAQTIGQTAGYGAALVGAASLILVVAWPV
jgi:sulfite exporter TauE/SafE